MGLFIKKIYVYILSSVRRLPTQTGSPHVSILSWTVNLSENGRDWLCVWGISALALRTTVTDCYRLCQWEISALTLRTTITDCSRICQWEISALTLRTTVTDCSRLCQWEISALTLRTTVTDCYRLCHKVVLTLKTAVTDFVTEESQRERPLLTLSVTEDSWC